MRSNLVKIIFLQAAASCIIKPGSSHNEEQINPSELPTYLNIFFLYPVRIIRLKSLNLLIYPSIFFLSWPSPIITKI